MRAYYEPCGGNFGDMFTKFFIETTYAVPVERSKAKDADLVGAGSILQNVPGDFRGHVVGTGFMFYGDSKVLPHARIHAVRGPLTAARLGVDAPFGDIGILASEYVFPPFTPSKRYKTGVIAHYVDKELLGRGDIDIDILSPPMEVIMKAAECEHILTSSLHGLILADSLGIPRTWVPCNKVLGEGFKFQDYHRSLGEDIELLPNKTYKPSPHAVGALKRNARKALDVAMSEVYR